MAASTRTQAPRELLEKVAGGYLSEFLCDGHTLWKEFSACPPDPYGWGKCCEDFQRIVRGVLLGHCGRAEVDAVLDGVYEGMRQRRAEIETEFLLGTGDGLDLSPGRVFVLGEPCSLVAESGQSDVGEQPRAQARAGDIYMVHTVVDGVVGLVGINPDGSRRDPACDLHRDLSGSNPTDSDA